MKRKRVLIVSTVLPAILLCLVWTMIPSPNDVRYTITDLGTLPGEDYSSAGDINNLGTIVGDSGAKTFIWNASEGMTDLGVQLWDCRINDLGQVVGRGQIKTATMVYSAPKLWVPTSGLTDLGSRTDTSRVTHAINNRGEVAWNELLSGVRYSPKLWNAITGSIVLGATQGEILLAHDINDSGQVLCWIKMEESGSIHSAIWRSTLGIRILDATSGFPEGFDAYCLNNRGTIAGLTRVGRTKECAILWRNGKSEDLGSLGGSRISIRDINNRDRIVGTCTTLSSDLRYSTLQHVEDVLLSLGNLGDTLHEMLRPERDGSRVGEPFLWEEGIMTDLTSLIPQDSGWTLLDVRAINDAGQIVGNGRINGAERAFLLTPTEEGP